MPSGPSPDIASCELRRHEFQCLGPVLLVVPDDMLALWEGEFAFWAGAASLNGCVPCSEGLTVSRDLSVAVCTA